jgi:glucosyl-3-phosphoglycerate synthase
MIASDADTWAKGRTFHHSRYSPAALARAKAQRGLSVSICLPARECASTVGEIVRALSELRLLGAIDEVVVVDAASADGTAEIAESAGALVCQEAELLPNLGPVLGKGDAMWRALTVLSGEIVCYLDADTIGFRAHYAAGLIGPLLCGNAQEREDARGAAEDDARGAAQDGAVEQHERDGTAEEIAFVKALYRRPFEQGGVLAPEGGGRVNQLLARPALGLFYPELAAVAQPLAGEIAARRELLERIPFVTGYGVEIGMLIDVWREVGLDGLAQVDLDERRNRHQPLAALEPMARTVLATILGRAAEDGRVTGVQIPSAPEERPPLAGTPPGAANGGAGSVAGGAASGAASVWGRSVGGAAGDGANARHSTVGGAARRAPVAP